MGLSEGYASRDIKRGGELAKGVERKLYLEEEEQGYRLGGPADAIGQEWGRAMMCTSCINSVKRSSGDCVFRRLPSLCDETVRPHHGELQHRASASRSDHFNRRIATSTPLNNGPTSRPRKQLRTTFELILLAHQHSPRRLAL